MTYDVFSVAKQGTAKSYERNIDVSVYISCDAVCLSARAAEICSEPKKQNTLTLPLPRHGA